MLKRLLLCITILAFTVQSSQAQIKKGYKALRAKNYPAAIRFLKKPGQKPRFSSAISYGIIHSENQMAKIGPDSLLSKIWQLERAYQHWSTLSAKEQKKVKRKAPEFDTALVHDLRNQFEFLLLSGINDSFGILAYEDLLKKLPPKPDKTFQTIRRSGSIRLIAWHLKRLKTCDYQTLNAIYNRYNDVLLLRGTRYPSVVGGFIWEAFVRDSSYRAMSTFIQDNPWHWIARDCWAAECAAAVRSTDPKLALKFLREHPWSILDDFPEIHFARLCNYGSLLDTLEYNETERQQIRNLQLGWDISDQYKAGVRKPDFDEVLKRYLSETAPAKRAYDRMKIAIAAYQRRKQWDKALQLVNFAKPLYPDVEVKGCEDRTWLFYRNKQAWLALVEELFAKPSEQIKQEIVPGLSTPVKDEKAPLLSPDQRTLYFAMPGPKGDLDVYATQKDSTGFWKTPQRQDIWCSPDDDLPLSMTQDGREMLLSQAGKFKISICSYKGWNAPFGLPLTVNQMPWLGRGSLSPDGKTFIFEGAQTAAQGHESTPPFIDLYMMNRSTRNMGWTNPYELPFCTQYSTERYPVIGADNHTLFFSSEENSLGEADLFATQRLDDTWKNWGPVQNLGKEFNTLEDEVSFWLSPANDGKTLVYSAESRDKNRQEDLWTSTLPSFVRGPAQKVLVIPIQSSVQKLDDDTRRDMILRVTDPATGAILADVRPQGISRFFVTLPAEQKQVNYQVLNSPAELKAISERYTYMVGEKSVQDTPGLAFLEHIKK
jgi:hypothetical protein